MVTNLELAERIKADLNELIDRRGNVGLIPALIRVQAFIDEIHTLKNRVRALELAERERVGPYDGLYDEE